MIHIIPTVEQTTVFLKADNDLEYSAAPPLHGIRDLGWKYQIVIITESERLRQKSELNTNGYYYIKNHYNEWYIGKFNGDSFDFIDGNGNFDTRLFICEKIIASNSHILTFDNQIGESDLKFVCEFYNKYKMLPKVYECGVQKKFINNDVVIRWAKSIEVTQTTTDSEPKTFTQDLNASRPIDFHWRNKKKDCDFDVENDPAYLNQYISENILVDAANYYSADEKKLIEPHEAYCAFIDGAKSKAAKQYHQKDMFTKNQLKDAVRMARERAEGGTHGKYSMNEILDKIEQK